MPDVTWKQTFQKDGVVYKNAAVSVYLAGTTTAVPVFDSAGVQRNDAPQCYTDAAGYVEFTLNSDDFSSGQLFDLSISPNSVCSSASIITLPSMMILQDTEGGRAFKQVFYQAEEPTSAVRKDDIWFDTDDYNHQYVYDGSTWVSARDTANDYLVSDYEATKDGVVNSFYTDTEPATDMNYGDFWIDISTPPVLDTDYSRIYRYEDASGQNGTVTGGTNAWRAKPNSAVGRAFLRGGYAEYIADGKIQTFYQDAAPESGMGTGDLWFDTNYDNHPYRYSGASWESCKDGSIAIAGLSNGVFGETWESESRLSYWTALSGGSNLSIVISDGVTGGKLLRIGDNSGDDSVTLVYNQNIPFDPARLYRIKVRARRTAGSGKFYAGWVGMRADGTTYCNVNGTDSYSSQHYHAANNVDLGATWELCEGYTYSSAATGQGTVGTIANPGEMQSNVAYIRPCIVANWTSTTGTTDVDSFIVEVLPISADYIKETATKYWAVEADADNTATNTSANTTYVDDVPASDVAGWAYSGNTAKINGGVVADYIQSSNYDGSTEGIKFDMTNARIYVYEEDGLQVLGSGTLKIMAGINPNVRVIYDKPGSTDDTTAYMYSGDGYAEFGLWSTVASKIYFALEVSGTFGGTGKLMILDADALYPYTNADLDLGTTTKNWKNLYLSSTLVVGSWSFSEDVYGNLLLKYSGTKTFVFGTDGKFWTLCDGDGSEGPAPSPVGWVGGFD